MVSRYHQSLEIEFSVVTCQSSSAIHSFITFDFIEMFLTSNTFPIGFLTSPSFSSSSSSSSSSTSSSTSSSSSSSSSYSSSRSGLLLFVVIRIGLKSLRGYCKLNSFWLRYYSFRMGRFGRIQLIPSQFLFDSFLSLLPFSLYLLFSFVSSPLFFWWRWKAQEFAQTYRQSVGIHGSTSPDLKFEFDQWELMEMSGAYSLCYRFFFLSTEWPPAST